MSKKTRKKSSKPAPKSRKTPARKPTAAKTAPKAARRSDTTSAKKPAAKTASKTAKTAAKAGSQGCESRDKTAKTAPTKASHKPTSKPLKIQSIGPAQNRLSGAELVEGAIAPSFSLPRDGGGSVSLADYAGKKLVLFFYPRADTPGCTREAIDFTRLRERVRRRGSRGARHLGRHRKGPGIVPRQAPAFGSSDLG